MGYNRNTTTDNYQTVTDAIVAALEKGVAPWVCPWDKAAGLPHNGASGHVYSGINMMLCWAAGFGDPRWFTFNQVGDYGKSHVRKGSKGTKIVFWKFIDQTMKDSNGQPVLDSDGKEQMKRLPLLKVFTVFNYEQVEWDTEHMPKGTELKDIDPTAACADAQALLDATGAKVTAGGGHACYIPSEDRIEMPLAGTFDSADSFWSTQLHELVHWTGAPTRCGRDLTGRFGASAYAMEELIAEMGAAFLCADLGIQGKLQHESYIASWLKVLRGDKYAVFSAASRAKEAAQWLHEQAGKAVAEEVEAA